MSELQQRLELALATAQMAVWDSNVVGGQVMEGSVNWSSEGAALMGLEPRPLCQSFREFLDMVHPDDRLPVLECIQQHASRCCGYELEYRIVRPDGKLCWLAARAHVICNNHGVPERTLGIVWDVTEHKQDELRVAQDKELAEVTLSSIGDGVITTDADGKVLFLNRAAERLTGWSNRQAHALPVEQVLQLVGEPGAQAPEHVAVKCLRLRHAVGGSALGQLVTRGGHRIAVEESAAPIWSQQGDMLGVVAVFHDVSHERRLAHELSWQATHDALTGLINRREFENIVTTALASAKQEGHRHALLYLDLDRFNVINDTCGHGTGDLLLQLLAKMLQHQLREGDVLARLGGDELGILLPYCPPAQALAIASGVRQAVRDFHFSWDRHNFELGASIGLVEIDENSRSMTELLIAADQACYLAKEQGRNRVHRYQETDLLLAERHGQMLWVTRLNEAFAANQFRLVAQPIVGLHDGYAGHDEVLVRIAKGDQLILPGAFIPAAERYDMMGSIDRWVIEHVCRHVHGHRDDETELLAVNLSGVSLNDDAMRDFIVNQFDVYGVDPRRICFEITETALIANLSKAQRFIATLRDLGCRFALDDFGSGLSSFAYLKSLPVDFLKIDGVFIRGIADNPINRALVKAINDIGHVMGIATVAEYVEDGPTLSVVRELGIDYAQGYAVGRQRALETAAA